jgi:hypothetical protein
MAKRPVEYSSETLVIRTNCSFVTLPKAIWYESFVRLLDAARKRHALNADYENAHHQFAIFE